MYGYCHARLQTVPELVVEALGFVRRNISINEDRLQLRIAMIASSISLTRILDRCRS
jgi:hypothetical protein